MMRSGLIIALMLGLAACGGGDPGASPAVPANAGSNFPDKCRAFPTFDQECIDLYDDAYGDGAGQSEKTRLGVEHSYGGRHKPSTAKPAPRIGGEQ